MEPKRLMLRPFAKDPRARPAHDDRGVPQPRPPARAATSPTRRRSPGARSTTASLVVFEGAQGTLLDIDHGTYPFVTSSNPVAGAACVGAGVGPDARSTRSGASPRPTPRASARGRSRPSSTTTLGERIREAGGEFGTTTGRPRRTGWLDLVALRYAARVNGLTGLVVTKLDVLTGIDPLHVGGALPRPRGRHASTSSPTTSRSCTRCSGDLRRAARLARGHPAVPLDRRAARATPRPTSSSSATSSASRS